MILFFSEYRFLLKEVDKIDSDFLEKIIFNDTVEESVLENSLSIFANILKRYYNQKAGAGMEAVLNIKRGIHNVALAASKLNELLNDKLSDGASLEDVPVVIGYMKQINDLANQFPNTIKALNVAEENLLYEQENVAGRGGVEIQSLFDIGFSFEVFPGITSSISVPAYA